MPVGEPFPFGEVCPSIRTPIPLRQPRPRTNFGRLFLGWVASRAQIADTRSQIRSGEMQVEIGHGSLASLGPLAYKVAHQSLPFSLSSPPSCLRSRTLYQPSPLATACSSRSCRASWSPIARPADLLTLALLKPSSVTRTMPSQKSESSASSTRSIPPDQLIALPSLACSLSSLPQAKSIDGLSLHPTMLAQRNAESQAKVTRSALFTIFPIVNMYLSIQLQKALSKSSTSTNLSQMYAAPPVRVRVTPSCAGTSDTLPPPFSHQRSTRTQTTRHR